MSGAILPVYRWQINYQGAPAPGAVASFFLSGTDTPAPVYADAALNTARGVTVAADAEGILPIIYLAAQAYRVIVKTSDGVTIFPAQDGIYDFGQLQLAGGIEGDVTLDGSLTVLGATYEGTGVGYPTSADAIEPYVIPASLVLPAATPGIDPPNPEGPSDQFHLSIGNLLVLPKIRSEGTFDDFNGWRPNMYYRDTWTTSDGGVTENPYYAEGSPKLYVGGGVIVRDANDTSEISLDRFETDSDGNLIEPTESVTIGRIYSRMAIDQGGGRFGLQQRTVELFFRYIHDAGGGNPGGSLQFGFARAGEDGSREIPVVFQSQDQALLGVDTGITIWSGLWPSGSLKQVYQGAIQPSAPCVRSTGAVTVAAGATVYAGIGNAATDEMDIGIPLGVAGTLSNFYARSGVDAGVGQTFTYFINIDGTNSALTCVTSGATQASSDLINTVSVSATARVSVQIVASAGAAVTYHTFGFKLANTGVYLTREA